MIKISKDVEDKIKQLVEIKRHERAVAEERRRLEEEIIGDLNVDLDQDNDNIKFDDVKINFGMENKWDQSILDEIRFEVPDDLWPFKAVWKEDGKRVKFLENNEPDIWKVIETALTVQPKRPYFQVEK